MISYNCLTVPDTAAHEKHIEALKPPWLLYKDNLAYADLIGSKFPFINVTHRDYAQYQGDDDLPHRISPSAWITTQKGLGFLDVWRYCCNESGFNEHTLLWINTVIEVNAQLTHPLRLVVGNFSAGTPQPDDWKQPQAVKLLQYLNQYRAWLVLGFHDYFGATPTSGMYGGYPINANIASAPTDAPGSKGLNLIPMDKWPQDTTNITLWHCGRWRFMLKVCNDLGIPSPRIVITEWGADDLGDIKPWLETLQKTVPYTSIRGWRSLKNQWAAWYGDNIELAYYNMLTYLDKAVYAGSPVEAQLLFAWGDSGGWEQFRVDNAPELQRRLELYAGVNSTPPFDYGDMIDAEISVYNVPMINLRANPGVSSADLGDLRDGDKINISENHSKSGDFEWFKVIANGITGFIADTPNWHITRVISPTPQEPPETAKKAIVVRLRLPKGMTEDDARALINNAEVQIIDDE